MDGKGLPYFSTGTFKGNKVYYVAAAVLYPDQPLWSACRDALVRVNLIEPHATADQTWATLSFWQTTGPSLFATSALTTHPREPDSLLRQIEPIFLRYAHNS